jgi:zinc-ribbon domain
VKAPETCPNCGADVPPKAKACPECGADENTGWSEGAYASKLNLPDESFDYDEFVQRELEPKKKPIPFGIHWFWWVVAIVVLGAFVIALVGRH